MFESRFLSQLPLEIIALDEVGRSPLCGPVVIGGMRLMVEDHKNFSTLLRSLRSIGVKDSKVLNTDKRQKILNKLGLRDSYFREMRTIDYKNYELSFTTFEVGPEIIDEQNIFQSVLLGMRQVVSRLAKHKIERSLILIDGPFLLNFDPLENRWIEIPVIRGDGKSVLIGLSSILAKEVRDSYMRELHLHYPQYGFNENMGYPTKRHREALKNFGPTPLHRKSFGIVKAFHTNRVE